jgi:FlaG/FlaF family flagellin (archaellin)
MSGGVGISSILSTLQQGVQAINNLAGTVKAIFPQVTGTSSKAPATAGSVTFTSSEASLFILVTTSSGFTGKVPIYPQ